MFVAVGGAHEHHVERDALHRVIRINEMMASQELLCSAYISCPEPVRHCPSGIGKPSMDPNRRFKREAIMRLLSPHLELREGLQAGKSRLIPLDPLGCRVEVCREESVF